MRNYRHTITKEYRDIPMGHRIHTHPRCGLIHGHDWGFKFTFARKDDEKDRNGFVADFGTFKWLRDIVEEFDHSLLLSSDDPFYAFYQKHREELQAMNFAHVLLVEGELGTSRNTATCENIAQRLRSRIGIALAINPSIPAGLFLVSIEVMEGSKNTFTLYCDE